MKEATYGQLLDHNSSIVAHTKLKTRMESNWFVSQMFGMLKIHEEVYFLSYVSERRKKKKKQKKDKQN